MTITLPVYCNCRATMYARYLLHDINKIRISANPTNYGHSVVCEENCLHNLFSELSSLANDVLVNAVVQSKCKLTGDYLKNRRRVEIAGIAWGTYPMLT